MLNLINFAFFLSPLDMVGVCRNPGIPMGEGVKSYCTEFFPRLFNLTMSFACLTTSAVFPCCAFSTVVNFRFKVFRSSVVVSK